jgi:isochorismate pyruvate lyase
MKSPRACRTLEDVRTAVDAIDRELVKLLGKRTRYAMAALQFKADEQAIRHPNHIEAFHAARVQWATREGVSPDLVEKIYRAIVAESTRLHLAEFRRQRRVAKPKRR